MRYSFVFWVLGWLTGILATAMLAPVFLAAYVGEGAQFAAFSSVALGAFALAGLFILRGRGTHAHITKADLCAIGTLSWVIAAFWAALPFYMGGGMSFTESVFEAVSGLTTTGASILADPASAPFALRLWRAILQWIGGFAGILMGLIILAPLNVAGLELRRVPLPTTGSALFVQRLVRATRIIAPPYIFFTLLCAVALMFAGLSPFLALCLAFSTLSTGGFDPGLPAGEGITAWQMLLPFFMMLGAMNILHHKEALQTRFRNYITDPEIRFFFALILIATLMFSLVHISGPGAQGTGAALFHGIFTSLSLISTTGYVPNTGETQMLPFIPVIILMLIGGMSLSTAGGFKLLSLLLVFKQSRREISRLAHPHAIISAHFNQIPVHIGLMNPVWALLTLLFASLVAVAASLAALGLDFTSALGTAAATLSNTGPALAFISETGYTDMPAGALWLLAFAMIAGRVEYLLLFSLFLPSYWRR